MKKHNFCPILVIIIMICSAIISILYLPANIAVQWNEAGISGTASKFLIFIFPALSIAFYLLHNIKLKNKDAKFDSINLLIPLLLFGVQEIITFNALGYINMLWVNYQLMQTIALLIVGIILTVCGNKIPKFARNYYCGVKSPWGCLSDNLWTKTERFSGKIWVIAGLTIMILSFIQWKGLPIIVLCIIFTVILIPRIYSRFLYNKISKEKQNQ